MTARGYARPPLPHKHTAGLPVHSRTGGPRTPPLAATLLPPVPSSQWCMSCRESFGRVQAPPPFGWTGRGDWHARCVGPGAGGDLLQGPPRTERAVRTGGLARPCPRKWGFLERVVMAPPPRTPAYQRVRGGANTSSKRFRCQSCVVRRSNAEKGKVLIGKVRRSVPPPPVGGGACRDGTRSRACYEPGGCLPRGACVCARKRRRSRTY